MSLKSHRVYCHDHDATSIIAVLHENNKMMELNCTPAQYKQGIEAYKNGALLQDAFPFLSDGEREFLKSGITPEEWDAMFPEEEDW